MCSGHGSHGGPHWGPRPFCAARSGGTAPHGAERTLVAFNDGGPWGLSRPCACVCARMCMDLCACVDVCLHVDLCVYAVLQV